MKIPPPFCRVVAEIHVTICKSMFIHFLSPLFQIKLQTCQLTWHLQHQQQTHVVFQSLLQQCADESIVRRMIHGRFSFRNVRQIPGLAAFGARFTPSCCLICRKPSEKTRKDQISYRKFVRGQPVST